MKNTEIEIQVKIENSRPLVEFLEKNAEFKGENHQIDEYFTPEYRDFIKNKPIEEWLRLRDSGVRYSINYKKWHYAEDGKGYHADEYETKLEDLDQIKKILEVLNFKPIVTVDKLRKTWIYKDYEVDIDSVKGLGDFVEIEYAGREINLDSKATTAGMIKFLKNIGVGKIRRNYVGYPSQLLFPDQVKWEEQ